MDCLLELSATDAKIEESSSNPTFSNTPFTILAIVVPSLSNYSCENASNLAKYFEAFFQKWCVWSK